MSKQLYERMVLASVPDNILAVLIARRLHTVFNGTVSILGFIISERERMSVITVSSKIVLSDLDFGVIQGTAFSYLKELLPYFPEMTSKQLIKTIQVSEKAR